MQHAIEGFFNGTGHNQTKDGLSDGTHAMKRTGHRPIGDEGCLLVDWKMFLWEDFELRKKSFCVEAGDSTGGASKEGLGRRWTLLDDCTEGSSSSLVSSSAAEQATNGAWQTRDNTMGTEEKDLV